MTATSDLTDLVFAGPGAVASQVRARAVSAREVVQACLERIEALDSRSNAFRAVMSEPALAAADELDGSPLGDGSPLPLAGVPVAIKDEIPVAGQALTRGSRSYGPPSGADAEIVRRLRLAGAIPIGITNVPELMIFPWTASAANGITRNPWSLERTPGGSSGGSAAAVAAGLVPVATGSDGGGSLRIPAACCGLVGMKPTRGRVSMAPAGEGWLGLAVYGGLARSVLDSALLLDVVQGALPGDAHVAPPLSGSLVSAAGASPGRLRIAVSRRIPTGVVAKVSQDQRRAFEQTAQLLQELGHFVSERDPDYTLEASLLFTRLWTRGIFEESLRVPDRSLLERSTRGMATLGRVLTPRRRRDEAIAAQDRVSARLLKLWDEFDVLLTPGLATTAIAAEGGFGRATAVAFDRSAHFTPFTAAFNLTGQPAVALPAGFAADGLPVSVQLVGRLGGEELLYSLAAQIEQARPWAHARPAFVAAPALT